jgi:hypothetical protein
LPVIVVDDVTIVATPLPDGFGDNLDLFILQAEEGQQRHQSAPFRLDHDKNPAK